MSDGKVIDQGSAESWKAWAVGVVGAVISFGIAALTGAGSDQIFLQPGEDLGFAIGYGSGIGLLVWLVFNFTTLRGHTKPMRGLAFAITAVGGTIGVLQNL